jgi:hypothetical protein
VFRLAIRRKADKKRTYFDLLPPAALRLVASYLTPEEVLNTLLLVRPSFFEHLRDGVAWTELDDWNWLEHIRQVVLASADYVKLLGIDYNPVGRHLTSKWQRVAMGKQLRKIVVQDVDFVKGQRFSLSVKEVQFEIPRPLDGSRASFARICMKNLWEDYQPSPPAPMIESVSVGFSPRMPMKEFYELFYGQSGVSFSRGDPFFRAFPNASKLKFGHPPNGAFFDQPASVLGQLRELTVSYKHRFFVDTVFLYLNRMENLAVLELCGDAVVSQLNFLPQDYVHVSLRTLRIVDVSIPFGSRRVWQAIPRQFPQLRALHLDTGRESQLRGELDSSLLTALVLKRFRRLESIAVRGFDVPLDVALNLCAPTRIQSVVCHSLLDNAVALTDALSGRIERLREVPGVQVHFQIANDVFNGSFQLSFSRS